MPTLPSFDLSAAGELAHSYGRYCQALFKRELVVGMPPAKHPDLGRHLRIEAYQLVSVAESAFGNEMALSWRFEDFASKLIRAQLSNEDPREENLSLQFPPVWRPNPDGKFPLRTLPTTFVDSKGIIGWWYLPSSITESRQATILRAIRTLCNHRGTPVRTDSQGNWRSHPSQFSEGGQLKPGVATFSSCWYQQGHDGPYDSPSPSASLKGPPGQQFIRDMTESFAVLGGVIAITQPWLFNAGLEVLESLHRRTFPVDNAETLDAILNFWSNPFTAFSVIVNRESSIHRDISSPTWAYDLIYTGGTYRNGRFESPTLGCRFVYNPGTVIVGLGSLIRHGVAPVDGDRVCIVSYFRESMLERGSQYHGAKPPSSTQLRDFYLDTPM
ncbi:hypothetical protein CC1G_14763 [Coprinopsis cinerea okayama7|uniref:2OGFeDO JBP1/TET oxygenase domain-containing protein n=1 Tax=Coprinopsis cinerea (strain Okayama-7 / 130 / ATCC MYA-4618 / FGSC 9003) TaxID=240176 RepID=D6RNM6_COPC7|nr:hypothetical protein CC1G_14763 [Coprinopsis cinerea okayama7\|eukprot:XP_002910785.1 hypothetical protein CC1G_14763 [Coprinopsis cinerea okayama7\